MQAETHGPEMNVPPRCSAVALMLLGLLTACARQPIRPEIKTSSGGPQTVPDSVLVLRFLPSGQVEQSWQPAFTWSREINSIKSTASLDMGRIVFVSRRPRDCDQEQIDCHRDCMKRKPPYPSGPKRSFRHVNYCDNKCRELYDDCLKAEGLAPLKFQALDQAADWMRQNPEAVVLGSIVLIAGVSFVVLSAGSGLCVLAPLVLLP